MSDMISRADAIGILEDEMPGHYLSKKTQIVTKLRALPAVEVGVSSTPAQDVAGLAEDAALLLDAYRAVLVLHRVMDRHGLTAGALAAENIADRIVAAHPEFPALCALRGAALTRMKEAGE